MKSLNTKYEPTVHGSSRGMPCSRAPRPWQSFLSQREQGSNRQPRGYWTTHSTTVLWSPLKLAWSQRGDYNMTSGWIHHVIFFIQHFWFQLRLMSSTRLCHYKMRLICWRIHIHNQKPCQCINIVVSQLHLWPLKLIKVLIYWSIIPISERLKELGSHMKLCCMSCDILLDLTGLRLLKWLNWKMSRRQQTNASQMFCHSSHYIISLSLIKTEGILLLA